MSATGWADHERIINILPFDKGHQIPPPLLVILKTFLHGDANMKDIKSLQHCEKAANSTHIPEKPHSEEVTHEKNLSAEGIMRSLARGMSFKMTREANRFKHAFNQAE